MKRKSHAGITSVSLPIFVTDTSSSTGAGLSGLAFNTASLTAEYRRQGQATWTAISLVTNTLGTYTSGGFIADGSLAGSYEFCPPNAALASGARWVAFRLYGAANMKPVLIEIELDVVDYQDANLGLTNLDAAITSRPTAAAIAAAVMADVSDTVGADVVATNTLLFGLVASGDHTQLTAHALALAPSGGGSGVTLATVLNAPRAVDALGDGAWTVNDVFWSIAALIGTNDVSSGTSELFKTPAGTTIRTAAITTSATNPFGANFPVKRG